MRHDQLSAVLRDHRYRSMACTCGVDFLGSNGIRQHDDHVATVIKTLLDDELHRTRTAAGNTVFPKAPHPLAEHTLSVWMFTHNGYPHDKNVDPADLPVVCVDGVTLPSVQRVSVVVQSEADTLRPGRFLMPPPIPYVDVTLRLRRTAVSADILYWAQRWPTYETARAQ